MGDLEKHGNILITSHYPDDNEGNVWLSVGGDSGKLVFIAGEVPCYVPGDIVDFGEDYLPAPTDIFGYLAEHRVNVSEDEIVVTLRIRRST